MPRLEGECAATPSRQARGASLVGCAVQRISQPFQWLHAVRALESNAIAREHPRAAPRTLAQSQSRGIDDVLAHPWLAACRLVASLGIKLTRKEVERVFSSLDTNDSGSIGFEEFHPYPPWALEPVTSDSGGGHTPART